MIFNGHFGEPWAEGEARESKLVFIGKNLDAKALAARFDACLATPENLRKKADALRFAVGDRVECKTGCDEWTSGTVVALLYRDDKMPQGKVAPYQIELDDDEGLIWAPLDDDRVIRVPCTETDEEESEDEDEADAKPGDPHAGHAHASTMELS